MSWSDEGLFFGQANKGILRVSANGGQPEVIVATNGDELAHGPQVLPGGEQILFTLAKGAGSDRWDKAQIVVQSRRTGDRKTIITGGSDARYLPTGHIVYALGGILFAIPFDVRRLETTGGPVPIVEGVYRGAGTGTAQASMSTTGSLMFVPGPTTTSISRNDLALIDRKGVSAPLNLPPGSYQYPRVSPDGTKVTFGTDDGKDAVIWVYDLSGKSSMQRLTFGGGNRYPIWTADGRRIAFQSDREGDLAIFWQHADGTGAAERITKPEQGVAHLPESWAPNGEGFVFDATKDAGTSLWMYSLRDRKATPFGAVQTRYPTTAVFSPDRKWVAYYSAETGGGTVFVQPFPATGAKYQVSKDETGHAPIWSADGKELFYIPSSSQFVVVNVRTQPTFTFSNPVPVPKAFTEGVGGPVSPRNHDITSDGRFVGVVAAGQQQSGASGARVHVVLNWFDDLKARVPINK